MRTHRTLIASLTLNIALAGVWLVLHERAARPAEVVKATEPVTETNENVVPPPVQPETIVSNPPPIPFRWPMLETNDARVYLTNLRNVDCPEHVLRELLVTKIEKHYRPKLRTEPVIYEPWAGRDRRDADRRNERGRVAGLRREQAALIRELLGYDWNSEVSREWNREAVAGVFLGFLTDFKAQQVMAEVMASVGQIEERFSFLESRIIVDEDLERFASFRRGISQELSYLLTPQELDELETRAQLGLMFGDKIHLEGMDPTGAELRAIMAASRNYQDVLSVVLLDRFQRTDEPDNSPKWREFESVVSTSLGAARFADFQRAQQKDFREAFQFTKQQQLPKTVAVTLYEAQRDAEAQRREIAADQALTLEERKLALEVLQTATAASVAQTLGKQFTNYFNGNGRWLKQLSSATSIRPATREARR